MVLFLLISAEIGLVLSSFQLSVSSLVIFMDNPDFTLCYYIFEFNSQNVICFLHAVIL